MLKNNSVCITSIVAAASRRPCAIRAGKSAGLPVRGPVPHVLVYAWPIVASCNKVFISHFFQKLKNQLFDFQVLTY